MGWKKKFIGRLTTVLVMAFLGAVFLAHNQFEDIVVGLLMVMCSTRHKMASYDVAASNLLQFVLIGYTNYKKIITSS